MAANIDELVEMIMHKRCRLETTDGSIRIENVMGMECLHIDVFGDETDLISYPTMIYFDEGQVDGVDLRVLRSIEVLGDAS